MKVYISEPKLISRIQKMPFPNIVTVSPQSRALDIDGMTPRDLVSALRNIEGELQSLTGSTEEEFLVIGAGLHDFQQRAGDITAIAQDLVNLVAGEEIVNGNKSLERIVGRMDFILRNALKKNEQSSSTLCRILTVLDDLDDPLTGFRKINKVLRMLGISTRIESTRLAEGAEGFDNLASDVQQLYVQINEKASSVNDLKKKLSVVVRQTIDRVKSIEAEQRAEVWAMLDHASSSLGVLAEVNAKCTGVASSITTALKDVSRNFAEVVTSMQFHDITRQQIEHAGEALADLCRRLDRGLDPGIGADDLDGIIGEALAVSELQSAQLAHAASELTDAVENILENLRGIAKMEEAISMEAREMAGSADKSGSSFFKDMESNLTSVADALQRSAVENRSLVVALEGVDGTIEEISLFVKSIETIGEEIELIAINAQIKAASTGKEGAALGVLAEAIQRLSLDARSQTDTITNMLNSISDASGDLCRDVDAETSSLETEVREITTNLGELLRMLHKINGDFISLLESIDRSVESLNSDIGSAAAGITVHQRIETVLSKVIGELAGLVSLMRPMVQSSPNGTSPASLADLSGRYTMHSERKIHNEVAAAKNVRDYDLVTASPPPPVEAAGEFGENVELF
jgi:methyl-accepting chemotaxis protein